MLKFDEMLMWSIHQRGTRDENLKKLPQPKPILEVIHYLHPHIQTSNPFIFVFLGHSLTILSIQLWQHSVLSKSELNKK